MYRTNDELFKNFEIQEKELKQKLNSIHSKFEKTSKTVLKHLYTDYHKSDKGKSTSSIKIQDPLNQLSSTNYLHEKSNANVLNSFILNISNYLHCFQNNYNGTFMELDELSLAIQNLKMYIDEQNDELNYSQLYDQFFNSIFNFINHLTEYFLNCNPQLVNQTIMDLSNRACYAEHEVYRLNNEIKNLQHEIQRLNNETDSYTPIKPPLTNVSSNIELNKAMTTSFTYLNQQISNYVVQTKNDSLNDEVQDLLGRLWVLLISKESDLKQIELERLNTFLPNDLRNEYDLLRDAYRLIEHLYFQKPSLSKHSPVDLNFKHFNNVLSNQNTDYSIYSGEHQSSLLSKDGLHIHIIPELNSANYSNNDTTKIEKQKLEVNF